MSTDTTNIGTDPSSNAAVDLTTGTPAAPTEPTTTPGTTVGAAPATTQIQEGATDPASPDKPATELAPIEYTDFTFPEGFQKEDTLLSQFTDIAKNTRLPQAEAQKLVDLGVKLQNDFQQRNQQIWADTKTEWQNQIKSDPEIGGNNLDASKAAVAKTIDQFGGKDAEAIREALFITGAGDNPALAKYIIRMSKVLTEGGPLQGRPTNGGRRDPAATLYPNQPN